MSGVSNKTQKPLSVPLPGGKTLHLGPGKTAQISAKAAADLRLKKLVDAGEIEIVDEVLRPTAGPGGSTRSRRFIYGDTVGSGGRRSGNR